ncbi:unnamed protein product [[Candida] boidinii]|nr:unnamed protein product [[Candida] boidinii]
MDSEDTSSRYVPDYRKANFKNKNRFQQDEVRRRRETQQVELRKQKREELLTKRRNFTDTSTNTESNTFNDSENEDEEEDANTESIFYNQLQEELPKMMNDVLSNDLERQIESTIKFRQILSKEHNPPIDLVIESGVVPRLVEFMQNKSCC